MIKRIVLYLVRKKLGLAKFEHFRFVEQKSDAVYWFGDTVLYKQSEGRLKPAGVSLNWLLSDDCMVIVVNEE